MPPKKGKGIVSSGNAGNSSKATSSKNPRAPAKAEAAPAEDAKPPPLFPPGSKFPLSLLNERCQKNGWEKAIVDSRKHPNGYSFVVTLQRINIKTRHTESVRMEPYPPYIRPTAIEARHWGATYAMYRFCNGLQLNRVLPPGPREYWEELVAEQKAAPAHQSWMYEADPFSAKKALEERQAVATKAREEREKAAEGPSRSAAPKGEFSNAPEVKMSSELRALTEDAIKKALSLYSDGGDRPSTELSPEDSEYVKHSLHRLGFTPSQAKKALDFLSEASPMASKLLSGLSPLEAAIEYLVLHVPECDLSERFLPSNNSSNPFVTSAHSGAEDLKRRWIEDKAIKEAGFPAHVVKEGTAHVRLLNSWGLLIASLGRRLIGDDITQLAAGSPSSLSESDEKWAIQSDEADAMGATYLDPSHLIMPLFSAPIELHVVIDSTVTGCPPMFLSSKSVPAYVRLHLLAQLIRGNQADTLIEPGEGFLMACMRLLEDEWASVESNGPPEMSSVLQYLLPSQEDEATDAAKDAAVPVVTTIKRQHHTAPKGDPRSDDQVRQDFDRIRNDRRFAELLSKREKLPAFVAKNEFMRILNSSRVVIVVGETGCGKTTQLPQFILDDLVMSGRGSSASILVTQPRRLSAISVAARVSTERLDDGSVGYAIRGESKQDRKTKLLFCTTGVVLRRLGSGDVLQGVTHIIVDEVHERSVDGDFLLLELKELLKKHSTLKVILMSATINHQTFVDYFDGAPLLTIPGFAHPVKDLYLEDFLPLINYKPPISRGGRKVNEKDQNAFRKRYTDMGLDNDVVQALENVIHSDRVDYKLIAALVLHITLTVKQRGGVLIFLPGVQEIRRCLDAIDEVLQKDNAVSFPLHANLSNDEQRKVFTSTPKWKIIAATNVAETSITIDDVTFVIDAGKVKETAFDPESGLSRILEVRVSRAAARQRRGRAGRTKPGTCYKLYTRHQEERMAHFPIPEILRVPLESISLTVKVMREDDDVKRFLDRAISPPNITAMDKAWRTLQDLGAIDQEDRLTALGRHMSLLPVDLRLGKMLILGTIFSCLEPILTIAAGLSSKPLFLSPMDMRTEAQQARARFARDESDLFTDLNAFDACAKMRGQGKSAAAIRTFCESNYISATTVRDIASLREDFLNSLTDLGFISFGSKANSPSLNVNSTNTNVVKAVVLGGLWPRVARVQLPKSAIKFDKVQGGTVQRKNTAQEFKLYDMSEGRVFLHPGSMMFSNAAWKSSFVAYFSKQATSKVFLRDATEVPLYGLLLFGGPVSINHVAGGVTIGNKEAFIRLRAWPRIGVLVNQLRSLLDTQLQKCIEEGTVLDAGQENPVIKAMLALLTGDGLTGL